MRKFNANSLVYHAVVILLSFAACKSACAESQPAPPPLVLQDLGRANVPLDGQWQFQTGDDPAWASPAFDDSAWQEIQVGRPWEGQGHPGYTGFGWYRRRIVIPASDSGDWRLALSLTNVDSACEVYWNGVLMGSVGKVPPHPVWYLWFLSPAPAVIPLGAPHSGVLAIRVWKAPHVYLSSIDEGGLNTTPQAGSLEAITGLHEIAFGHWLRSHLITLALNLFSGMVGLLALLSWFRNRERRMLLWLALAMVYPLAGIIVFGVPGVATFAVDYGMIGPMVAINDVAVWFLMLYLLGIHDNLRLVRWTKILAVSGIALTLVDSAMVCFDWTRLFPRFFLIADVGSTIPVEILELYGVIIILFAARKRLDAARWMLAISALLTNLFQGAEDITGLGQRWTHWTVADHLAVPLVTIGGNPLDAHTIFSTLMLLSVLYVAWRYSVEQSQRQSSLEQEYRSAQELQQVLIPEALPTLPGYAVTSAYRPAQEVGGDFFQLVSLPNNEAMLVIGDVSGKGLPAAMAVALIVGSIRSAVETTNDPAAVLSALNRRLHGRLRGGFTTCLVLRLDARGTVLIANAGHLPPFLNGIEVALPPALPLGLMQDAEYEPFKLRMASGDRLTLYTDGLLEARNPAGELFGFARIADLLAPSAGSRDAQQIAEAAHQFGQEDDITVLTLTLTTAIAD